MNREEMLNKLHSTSVNVYLYYWTTEGFLDCVCMTSKGTVRKWIGLNEWPVSVCLNENSEADKYILEIDGDFRSYTDYRSLSDAFESEWIDEVEPWETCSDGELEEWIDFLGLDECDGIPLFEYMELKDFLEYKADSISIDWKEIETRLGFPIHDGLKSFYSRTFAVRVKGVFEFNDNFFTLTGDDETLENVIDEIEYHDNKIGLTLELIEDQDSIEQTIIRANAKRTGKDDNDKYFFIGYVSVPKETSLVFNNSTGCIELFSFHGHTECVLAKSVDEFFEQINKTILW